MAKAVNKFVCYECGYESGKWSGKCPSCKTFNTLQEVSAVSSGPRTSSSSSYRSSSNYPEVTPITLENITTKDEVRIPTHIPELDRVLSGGLVDGSLTLLGGDPGIGKSTLLLQICQNIGKLGRKTLYISGEESATQIKMRADRLKVDTTNLYILSETNMGSIDALIRNMNPELILVDSIQTMMWDEISSVPGSVTQVRECSGSFMKIAKSLNTPVIIVSHVTKEGSIAGPKILEHIVDTVLYFEGESKASYRIIRSIKNRFGGTNEIGVFEMCETGLREIENPSEYMLSGRPIDVPGTSVTSCMEGTRPILAEVQALISYTNFATPRRTATGADYNRVTMLMAVLEKHAGMQFSSFDSYINIAGGLKINEPAIDLSIVVAIASSYRNTVIDPHTMVIGEVGLTGEVRAVSMIEQRILEAKKLGFKQCILPYANLKGLKKITDIKIHGVSNVSGLLNFIGK